MNRIGTSLLLMMAGLAVADAGAQSASGGVALSFGSFVAGSGGTITVNTFGGRSKSGGVLLSSQDSPASAATINISGTSNAAIAITLPADGTVLLSAGPATMALNGFTSSPSGSGVLSAGGTLQLSIGATLSVGLAQTPGSYSGSFNVSIDYQ